MLFRGLLPVLFALAANAQTTVFTYQGRLADAGAPATGNYDLRFTLHDAATAGNQIGNGITNAPTAVTNGLFTVSLDFGSAVFDGSARWLEIGVRPLGGAIGYTPLAPRQLLTSTPYAIRALTAGGASNLLGTLPTASLTGIVPDAQLSTNVAFLNSNAVFKAGVVGANFFGNGVGLTNVPGRIFEVIPTATNIQALANTGYLATNDTAAVMVTLPATANIRVGETVRVSASGAGGWILAQNAGQVILIGNLLKNVGLTLTPRYSSFNYQSIAASADGRKLVTAANGPGFIHTSSDYGATWLARASSLNWSAVASSGDGSKLVAVVNGAAPAGIYTSTDSGTNWSPQLGAAAWTSVASSVDGGRLVATIGGGPLYTWSSAGGAWTPHLNNSNWISVASSANGSNLVAAVQGSKIVTSADAGNTWAPRDINRNWISVASSADGTRLVGAVTSGQLYVSWDSGTNWAATGPAGAMSWTAVTSSADGDKMAAVFNTGGLYISNDAGATWLQRSGLPAIGWTSVALSGDGSTIAAVATANPIYVSSQATTTTGTAGYLNGTRLSAVEVVHCGNGVFMPITSMGTVHAR